MLGYVKEFVLYVKNLIMGHDKVHRFEVSTTSFLFEAHHIGANTFHCGAISKLHSSVLLQKTTK